MEAISEGRRAVAAVIGGLLALWQETTQVLRDEIRRVHCHFGDLRDRVKDLEDWVAKPSMGGLIPGTAPHVLTHDEQVALIDIGSNTTVAGTFAASPSIVVPNAVNNTGTGAASTVQLLNKSAGDLQRIGRHTLRLTPAGTPGTPTPSQAIRLWSLIYPRANFDRTPRVEVVPLSAAAGPLLLQVTPTVAGYDIYAAGGTITAGSAYDFQITVNPS